MEKEIVTDIIIWIDKNISTATNREVAKKSGYSIFHFQRMFRKVTGYNLGNYILRKKMNIARDQLLNTNKSIIDIAISLGYSSQQTFHRSFKRYHDVPPGYFRQEVQRTQYMGVDVSSMLGCSPVLTSP